MPWFIFSHLLAPKMYNFNGTLLFTDTCIPFPDWPPLDGVIHH